MRPAPSGSAARIPTTRSAGAANAAAATVIRSRSSLRLMTSQRRLVALAEVSARTQHARELFAPLGPTYDRYASLLSFRQDPAWRRFLVSRVPADALRVLDVASGTAAVPVEPARALPGRALAGGDQSTQMLTAGSARGGQAGLEAQVELREARAESL